MKPFLWKLLGEQHILTTTLSQYRQKGQRVNIAGRCYRVTRVHGDHVWGRPLLFQRSCDEIVIVESPLKHLRGSAQTSTATS